MASKARKVPDASRRGSTPTASSSRASGREARQREIDAIARLHGTRDSDGVLTPAKTTPTGRTALIVAVFAPPVGAVLGHLALRRKNDGRRRAWTAVVLGWALTTLIAVLIATGIGYQQKKNETAASNAAAVASAKADQARLKAAIAGSPSTGHVSAGFCAALVKLSVVVPHPDPATGLVQGYVTQPFQVNQPLIKAYTALGAQPGRNAKVYTAYAKYLPGFATSNTKTKIAQTTALRTAIDDDVLACIPLDKKNSTAAAPGATGK